MNIKRFCFNMIEENTYILSDETKEAVIIDPGCYNESERAALKEYVAAEGLIIKHLLNTHLHFDHVFGNGFVCNEYGLVPTAHKGDQHCLDDMHAHVTYFGIKMTEPLPPPIGVYIEEGDVFKFGNSELLAIHVPGHSQGSIVFYCEKDHFMLSGDVLFEGTIGRTDLEGGNFDQLMEGITTKLLVLPDQTVVYPGHGESTTIKKEKATNPYFKRS